MMGKQFRVHKCHEQRGSKDDITAWISLHEAQELLGKKGLINAIMALECLCTGHVEPQRVREEITKRLPGTQVVELGTRKLSREEARLDLKAESLDRMRREKEKSKHLQEKWENFSAVFLPLATVACIVLIGLLGWANVTDRETEIGILRAIGLRSSQLMKVFLLKALLIGLVGGAAGIALGYLAGSLYIGGSGEHDITFAELFSFPVLGFGIVVSVFISVVGGWIPALYASQRDPASILRDE